jgi:hypothetical protein
VVPAAQPFSAERAGLPYRCPLSSPHAIRRCATAKLFYRARFCINYFIDDLPPELRPDDSVGHREGITLEALAADQRYSTLDPDGTSFGWTDEVEELNAFLDRVRQ